MGDSTENISLFNKLGFDSSNHWMLYDESFQPFFSWLTKYISDDNILQENDVFEETELKVNKQFLNSQEVLNKLRSLEPYYPQIQEYTDEDVRKLEIEVAELTEMESSYRELIATIENRKSHLNRELNDIQSVLHELEVNDNRAYNSCMEKARELQEIQNENRNLCNESTECFAKLCTPPLFMHQMPLDDFYAKCDSFQDYLSMYFKYNFKVQNFLELDSSLDDIAQTVHELEQIQKQSFSAELQLTQMRIRQFALNKMLEEMDINQVHPMTTSQLKKETHELELANKNTYEVTYEILTNDLVLQLEQITNQQIELILYENTKHKLERATQRLANMKSLSKVISNSLSNAELLWMLMQLDLEKIKDRFDNSSYLIQESQSCAKRIEAMENLNAHIPENYFTDIYISKVSDILNLQTNTRQYSSVKPCLYDYEKFCRRSMNALKGIVSFKHYTAVLSILECLNSTEKVLSACVFDGPISAPIFSNVKFLEPIYRVKKRKGNIEKALRQLRSDFQVNVSDKIQSNQLWRFLQILWIWFLTEPKKINQAMEEISKMASKTSNVTVKTLCGLKRK